jgi:predicted metal-dependent hydrolase
MNYSYLYLLFMYYFNVKRDYYECHDVMEELWLEERRDKFYQGLLQVAVGLYHFRWNNLKGSVLLFEGAVEKLGPCQDVYDLTIEFVDEELKEMVESIQSEM